MEHCLVTASNLAMSTAALPKYATTEGAMQLVMSYISFPPTSCLLLAVAKHVRYVKVQYARESGLSNCDCPRYVHTSCCPSLPWLNL